MLLSYLKWEVALLGGRHVRAVRRLRRGAGSGRSNKGGDGQGGSRHRDPNAEPHGNDSPRPRTDPARADHYRSDSCRRTKSDRSAAL